MINWPHSEYWSLNTEDIIKTRIRIINWITSEMIRIVALPKMWLISIYKFAESQTMTSADNKT